MRWRLANNPVLLSLIVAVSSGALSATARGQGVFDAAGMAPVSSDLVIVVDGAAALRRGEFGGLTLDLMRVRGAEAEGDGAGIVPSFGETLAAWGSLSERLGWSGEESFDRLLGERAMLVSRRGGEGTEWAVVSWVSSETGERVRKRLDASLRSTLRGFPLFALEHGRYEMVVGGQREAPVLYLWSAERGGLGRELVTRSRGDGGGPLIDSEAMALTRRIAAGELKGEPDVLVMASLPRAERGGGGLARGDWVAAMAEAHADAVDLAFVDNDAALRPHLGQIEPWAFGMFRELSRGALASVVVSGAALTAMDSGTIPEELSETLRRLTGEVEVVPSRVAACVRAAPSGGVDISVGVESVDDPELARRGDAFMARVLTEWFGEVRYKGPPAVQDDEVRRVPLDAGVGGLNWERLAWTYRHCSPLMEGCASVWWACGVGTRGTLEDFAGVVSGQYLDTEIQPWVEAVDLRPRALVEALEAGGAAILPAALKRVEHATWRRFAVPSEGVVVGHGRIEFAGQAGSGGR